MSLKKWLNNGSSSPSNLPVTTSSIPANIANDSLLSSTPPPNSTLANNISTSNGIPKDGSNSSSSSLNSQKQSQQSQQHDCGDIQEEPEEDGETTPIFDMNELNPDFPYGDGSDKIFGMENFGNTCYCNSIVQCLYYTKNFRLEVISHPKRDIHQRIRKASMPGLKPHPAATLANNNNSNNSNDSNGNNGNNNGNSPNTNSSSYELKSIRMSLGRRTSSLFGRNKKESFTDEEDHDAHQQQNTQQQQQQSQQQNARQQNGSQENVITVPNIKSNSNHVIVGKTDDPNSNVDARKRAALVKGPIINLDHSLVDYNMKNSLFTSLKDLFEAMIEHESKRGVVSPSYLVETLKRENELFRSTMHQDAHEFLNFLLNEVIDTINTMQNSKKNELHNLFEGLLTNQTKCLTCENVSSRDETFLDLSIDLTDNETLETCLKQFSASEMLNGSNKFYCDNCHSLQEAEKKMGLRKLPKILALHLKRFKYSEEHQHNVKLFQKIKYPLYFKLESDIPSEKQEDGLKFYELYGVVVHIGGGPHHGHYVALVKTIQHGWLLFDDETVEKIDEKFVLRFTGDSPDLATAYVLFYQEISKEAYEEVINKPINEEITNKSEKNGVEEKIIRVNSNNTSSISSSQPSTMSSSENNNNNNNNNNNHTPDSKLTRPPPSVVVETPQEKGKLRTPSFSSIARLKSKSSTNTIVSTINTSTPPSSISTPPTSAGAGGIPQLNNTSSKETIQSNSSTPTSTTGSSFWKKKDSKTEDKEKFTEEDKDAAIRKKNRMSMRFGFKKNQN